MVIEIFNISVNIYNMQRASMCKSRAKSAVITEFYVNSFAKVNFLPSSEGKFVNSFSVLAVFFFSRVPNCVFRFEFIPFPLMQNYVYLIIYCFELHMLLFQRFHVYIFSRVRCFVFISTKPYPIFFSAFQK